MTFKACIDVETFLIEEGRRAPPLVVFGWAHDAGTIPARSGICKWDGDALDSSEFGTLDNAISLQRDVPKFILELYDLVVQNKGKFINHFLAFDTTVWCEFYPELIEPTFWMYENNYMECTLLRERLIDLAKGTLGKDFENRNKEGKPKKLGYALDKIAKRRLGIEMDKVTYRLGYGQLYDVPLKFYSEGAKDYVLSDVLIDMAVYDHQEEFGGEIPNSPEQARYDFALALSSCWGMRTDGERVKKYKNYVLQKMQQYEKELKKYKFVRANGTRDTKLIKNTVKEICEFLKVEPELTETGEKKKDEEGFNPDKYISTKAEFVDDLVAQLPADVPDRWKGIIPLSKFSHEQKILSTYVSVLEKGVRYPINPSYECLVETGRVSCSKPNFQNMPGKPGVRECFVPRVGYVFCSVDYGALELHTLAQACLDIVGWSSLADALNSGIDPHTEFAANHLLEGLSYKEALEIYKNKDHARYEEVNNARKLAKECNFGLGGGMGAARFQKAAKKKGIFLTLDECKRVIIAWKNQWPEMVSYFKIMGGMVKDNDEAAFEQLVSGRIRGNLTYTKACNTPFQGLASDIAKEACFMLQKACYIPGNVLYGSRMEAFIHDETLMSHPIENASERGKEQARIMIEAGKKFCRKVPLKADPCLMAYWSKSAQELKDQNGNYVVWDRPFDDVVFSVAAETA